MSEQPQRERDPQPTEDDAMSRREVLHQATKLAYVTPAVLLAMSATQTAAAQSAAVVVVPRLLNVVPADLLELIEEIEREDAGGSEPL